ncbi:hypothetical protein NFI96_017092, partial [Prochilodus magdalenae]
MKMEPVFEATAEVPMEHQ